MKIINQIKAWYNKVVADARQMRADRKAKALAAESRQVIQAMEFDGDIYLCYRGTPIIREDQFIYGLPDELEESRATYIEYVTNKDMWVMKEQEVTNFARFYMTFNKMKYTGDREELKRNIVRQYTWDRTDSLRAVTLKEYNAICDGIEKIYGNKDAYREAIRKHRSVVLKLMQKIGIDTTDWTRINAFCKDERIAGKEFARLDGEELEALSVKLRIIQKKGGLHKGEVTNNKKEPAQTVCFVMNGSATTPN